MVGITLSPEQIHAAPAEVRQWLEQPIAETLGLKPAEQATHVPARHLVSCSLEQARMILAAVRTSLPVVGVLFELGRRPIAVSQQGLHVLRLEEIARHVHLQTPAQVVACLTAIDDALQRLGDQPDAALTALDGAGHCLVAEATARSIHALWQEIVAARELAMHETATAQMSPATTSPPFQTPYAVSVPGITPPGPSAETVG